jgi:hypothetical protein
MSTLARLTILAAALAAAPALAADGHGHGDGHAHGAPAAQPADSKAARCEHGVAKTLCTRCNPKLAPVFKAKGDWCAEHERPESQCVLCHPELAKKGIK